MATTNKEHNNLTNQEFSIQISLFGLAFCMLNTKSNTISTLKNKSFSSKKTPTDLLDAVKHLFNTETALQHNFTKVTVVHVNEWSTLVPKPLFKEDALADYLKFNTKILKTDFLTFDTISQNDSVTVYAPFTNVNNYIFDQFGSFTYKHYSTVLIDQLLVLEKHSNTSKVYVNIRKNAFEIIAFDNGNLTLFNTFDFTTKEDFIYYLLFTLEQLQLNPETVKLVFLGQINKEDELYQIAYTYIRHVTFGNRMDTVTFTEQPETSYSNFTLLKSL